MKALGVLLVMLLGAVVSMPVAWLIIGANPQSMEAGLLEPGPHADPVDDEHGRILLSAIGAR